MLATKQYLTLAGTVNYYLTQNLEKSRAHVITYLGVKESKTNDSCASTNKLVSAYPIKTIQYKEYNNELNTNVKITS